MIRGVTKKSGRKVREQVAVVVPADDAIQACGASNFLGDVIRNHSVEDLERRKILKSDRARSNARARAFAEKFSPEEVDPPESYMSIISL